MNEIENILEKSSVFSRIGPDGKKRLASIAAKRSIEEGEILATAGETASFFYVLGKGSLLLSMAEGKALVLNKPGDFIAMDLLSLRGVYKTTVTALSGGMIYIIERRSFLEMIREDSNDAGELMRAWGNYLEETAPFVKKHENYAAGFEYGY